MEREDLKQIVERYDWGHLVFLDEGSVTENAWVVEPLAAGVRVYLTSERAGVVPESVADFASEPEALSYILERFRDRAESRRLIAAARKKRSLRGAGPAVKKLRKAVADLETFMREHQVRPLTYGVEKLSSILASGAEPTDIMLAARSAYDGLRAYPPRDGWSEAHVTDRKANAELERLKARLARILEPWTLDG